MNYQAFIRSKIAVATRTGFDVAESDLHPNLMPITKDAIRWALKGGRRGLFMAFGLHKTRTQLEMMRQTINRFSGRGLIVLPLGIRHEFYREAAEIDMEVQYVRTNEEALACSNPFMISNYERVRDGQLSPDLFTFASLDEASVLRGYGTKTYQEFLPLFRNVPYRFVATATPSPNRFKELIHYAGFLGVMDTGQALTRFFQRDSTKANNLTLYPHKEREFWLWVSSWGLFVKKPSDIGHSDEGYILPRLRMHWHMLRVSHEDAGTTRDGQREMFRDAAIGVTAAAAEKRRTMPARIRKAKEIIESSGPDTHWIVWHHLEDERRAIQKAIPESVVAYGSQDLEKREAIITGFSDGKHRILGTKPEISGSGCNFQKHCHSNIFLGIDYSFNDFIQSIHRTLRFGQRSDHVDVHVIYADSEAAIVKTLRQKWAQHNRLTSEMTSIIQEYGLGLDDEYKVAA